jgi:hypothetical protein
MIGSGKPPATARECQAIGFYEARVGQLEDRRYFEADRGIRDSPVECNVMLPKLALHAAMYSSCGGTNVTPSVKFSLDSRP